MKTTEVLVQELKDIAQTLMDRAEEIVGNAKGLNDFDIWITFPFDGRPEIEIKRTIVPVHYTSLEKAE